MITLAFSRIPFIGFQLKYDVKHVVAAINNIKSKRYARESEERQRDALMSMSFTTNDQARSKFIY